MNICFRMFHSLWIVSTNRREMQAFLTEPPQNDRNDAMAQEFTRACRSHPSIGRAAASVFAFPACPSAGAAFGPHENASITRMAGCLWFLTLIQSFDRPPR